MYEFKITIKIMSLQRRRNLRQNLRGNGHVCFHLTEILRHFSGLKQAA